VHLPGRVTSLGRLSAYCDCGLREFPSVVKCRVVAERAAKSNGLSHRLVLSGNLRSIRAIAPKHFRVPQPTQESGREDQTRRRLCLYNKKINLSVSLAGQAVGVKEVDHGIWFVSSMDSISAILIWRGKLCSPCRTPSGQKCDLCLRYGQKGKWSETRLEPATSSLEISVAIENKEQGRSWGCIQVQENQQVPKFRRTSPQRRDPARPSLGV